MRPDFLPPPEAGVFLDTLHSDFRLRGTCPSGAPLGLPALGATACMVEQDLRADLYFDSVLAALAAQGATLEIGRAFFYTGINGRMNGCSHEVFPFDGLKSVMDHAADRLAFVHQVE